MKRIRWAAEARNDLKEARAYLRTIDPALFGKIVSRSVEAAAFLAEHPEAGEAIGKLSRRRWRVARSPYVILYEANEDDLNILRVIHSARDWRRFL